MHRKLAVLLTVALLMTWVPASYALENELPIQISSPSALLIEPESGQVIFEQNADERRAVASVTKIMPILLVCEAIEQGRCARTDIVNISARASGMGGSQVLLDTGEQQSVEHLLKSMIVASANDATVAMGEFLFGSEQAMVKRMNERAVELGMQDTNFVNATGLPADGHYTTARNVAIMSSELIRHPLYFEFSSIWMDTLDHGDGRVTELTNTNRLTRLYDGCDGLKTGSTNEAGYCMSASAVRSGMRLIAVALGADTSKQRFADASAMLDYGFANYRTYTVAEQGSRVRGKIPVTNGSLSGIELMLGSDLTLLIAKGDEQAVELEPDLPESVPAPIVEGEEVGSIHVTLGGRVVGRIPVVAAESVERRSFVDGVNRLLKHWYYGA